MSATGFKLLEITGCVANSVGAYENRNVQDALVVITDCTFGHLYNRGGAKNTQVFNCEIVGSMSEIPFIFSTADDEELFLENCRFTSCENKFLEENWQGHGAIEGSNTLRDCKGAVKRLARTANSRGIFNHKFYFYNSEIDFKSNYKPEHSGFNTEDLLFIHNSTLRWLDKTIRG